MTEEELMKKIQELADARAEKFVFKKTARMEHIYTEELPEGEKDVFVLGSDMPKLIYRIFHVSAAGEISEIEDIKVLAEKSRHYSVDIKPTLKLVPPAVEESGEYEIVLENKMPEGAVEIKLKSSTGRDLTMIETYRYFDYVSRIFFVSCVAVSFGGQYLFSVSPDGKHVRLIVGNDENIRKRVDMITELLQNHVLPSYQTIDAGNKALTSQDVRGKVSFPQNDGTTAVYLSQFCYDDLESGNLFAFFIKENDEKNGLMFIQDIVTGRLTLSQAWTEEQKAAADRVQKLMAENKEEFGKHVHSFFADSLDLRYAAFKAGKLTAEAAKAADEEKADE